MANKRYIEFECPNQACRYAYKSVMTEAGEERRTLGQNPPLLFRLHATCTSAPPELEDVIPRLPIFVIVCPLCGAFKFQKEDAKMVALITKHKVIPPPWLDEPNSGDEPETFNGRGFSVN